MAQIRVYYDSQGHTLTVWFGNPPDEFICEETGDGVVLMKNQNGSVIGFEKLNFVKEGTAPLQVGVEAIEV